MFGIGEFAGLGRVSVRMLRHYDAIGLLRPAHVDPHSGYRYYTADQLRLLNRVIALKDLGFRLDEVQTLIDEKVDVAELRGMLRLRRAELAARMRQDAARLGQVDARLAMIEREGHMDTGDVIVKSVPATRVAQLSGTAAGYDDALSITENLTPLYPRLIELMERHAVPIAGAPIAWYEPAPAGPGDETIAVHAAFPVGAAEVAPGGGFEILTLPPVERAATALHHGAMAGAMGTVQKIATWIDANGHRAAGAGLAREIYLECPLDDLSRWVTEMQVAIRLP